MGKTDTFLARTALLEMNVPTDERHFYETLTTLSQRQSADVS